jgi:hypothetical protein
VRRFPAAALVALPLLVVGWLTAHDVAYHLVVPDARARAEALAISGHGYLAHAPLAIALCLTVALGGVATRLADGHGRAVPAAVATLPPAGFCVQELLERALSGDPGWLAVVGQPVFLVGLLLQLPLAVAALVVAAALTRAADAVRLARSRPAAGAPRLPQLLAPRFTVLLPPRPALASRAAGRAPPARL